MKSWTTHLRGLLVPWLLFAGTLGGLVALNEWKSDWFNVWIPKWTAGQFAWVLDLLGLEGRANGRMVSCKACSFEIIGECTAFFPAAVLLAAIVAYPAAWKHKLWGVAIGIPAVVGLNIVRLLRLCYLNRKHPEIFELVHLLVWQSLLIFFTLLLWLAVGGGRGARPCARSYVERCCSRPPSCRSSPSSWCSIPG